LGKRFLDRSRGGTATTGGGGWRVLIDEARVGKTYRTGIATDRASLQQLWTEIGLTDPLSDVDLTDEVVICFGAAFDSSCPNIRPDGVIVDDDLVYPEIAPPDAPVACTADANPHTCVVAIERASLPVGPFKIQLSDQDPPPGAPEERTAVKTDLSRRDSGADRNRVGADPALPESYRAKSGGIVEPDCQVPYPLDGRRGIEWLSELNGYQWHTTDPMPAPWVALIDSDGTIEVSVGLSPGTDPTITATTGSVAVTYRPMIKAGPGAPDTSERTRRTQSLGSSRTPVEAPFETCRVGDLTRIGSVSAHHEDLRVVRYSGETVRRECDQAPVWRPGWIGVIRAAVRQSLQVSPIDVHRVDVQVSVAIRHECDPRPVG
jgi:hypothetical protein